MEVVLDRIAAVILLLLACIVTIALSPLLVIASPFLLVQWAIDRMNNVEKKEKQKNLEQLRNQKND